MEIHQFHPSFAYGDAIGNVIIEIQKILRKMGYKSEIYCQYKDSNSHPSKNYKLYLENSTPENILIIHYSIGYDNDVLEFIKALPDKKLLIYHNITPFHYFTDINDQYEHYTRMGREQLKSLNNSVDFAVGVSEYNRQELAKLGFKKTGVLSVPIDFEKYNIKNSSLVKNRTDSKNILFVGRISPHKKQEDIIKIFYFYKKIEENANLYLVGSYEGLENYYDMLTKLVKDLKLNNVYFTGKIKFEELIAYYRSADIFLCMSEHEGFCVPLIESMIFDVPIMAYNSTAIPYTLGNSGILINKKNYLEIAEFMNILTKDAKFKEKIIKRQRERLKYFSIENIKKDFESIIEELVNKKKSIRIEGTFEDSYSLSFVNRNLALALNNISDLDISIFPTTGNGDYIPNLKIIKDPKVIELYNKRHNSPDFVIRNIYPPRIYDMIGRKNLIYFAWEESRIPKKWVNDFNKLDAILVPSNFVMNVLKDSGVNTRIFVVPNAINHELLNVRPKRPGEIDCKKYKFLNISSGFPRKGVDKLINAFSKEFKKKDNVCLIIKTFPNIHNTISKLIEHVRKDENCPDIIQIDRDIDDDELVWLYQNGNCLVYPTRGEGFCLPIAEAMLFKMPVIATGYSGHLDFCNNDNCFLIDYRLEPSKTHVKKEHNIESSSWAEPNEEDLRRLMRLVYENDNSIIIKNKIENGYKIAMTLTWDKSVEKLVKILNDLDKIKRIKVGIVSTFNTRCGIAEYTKFLLASIDSKLDIKILANYENTKEFIQKEDIRTVRCWDKYQDNLDELYMQIKNYNLNVVHFQFNFGFFKLKSLLELIKKLNNDNVKTIITFHSVEDRYAFGETIRLADYKEELKYIDKIWVHTTIDSKFLSNIQIEGNVVCIPHGIKKFSNDDTKSISRQTFKNKVIISSFGFMLPNKGILEIIESLDILKRLFQDILFLSVNAIYPENISKDYFEKCSRRVRELGLDNNVIFFTEYLRDENIIDILRLSDMVVMPYSDTKESASGAIRLAISSLKPVIGTNIRMFDEFRDEIFTIDKNYPENIAKGIKNLNSNKELQERLIIKSLKKIEEQSWANIANIYEKIIIDMIN